MLNGQLALHDIRDTEAFTTNIIRKANLGLNPQDHEDLTAWLIATCWELSTRNPQPWRQSFSGWVTPYLRQRITDWQRQHHGRTTWQFHNRTYTRTIPTLIPLHDRPDNPDPQTHRNPPEHRDPADLVRILRTRSSDEAWRNDQHHPPMPHRAA